MQLPFFFNLNTFICGADVDSYPYIYIIQLSLVEKCGDKTTQKYYYVHNRSE